MNNITLVSLALPSVVIVLLSSVTLLISRSWRLSIGALALQYVGVFILVGLQWSLPVAATKLVAGWMSSAVLGLAIVGIPNNDDAMAKETGDQATKTKTFPLDTLSGNLFRLLAAGLVALAVISVVPGVAGWIPGLGNEQTMAALILIGLGLLHLGLTANPLRVVFGLLTALSGFEIIYAAVEVSALVAGLLSGVTLGLALVGAYMVLVPSWEEAP